MNDFLTGFINSIVSDGSLEFSTVFKVLIIYLLALWLVFSLWVFLDARKRYQKWWLALTISAAVFILNFPALILYLVVRPDDDYYSDPHHSHGGVEVPVIRFVDEKGHVKLSLNLEINPNWSPTSDMNLEVSWDGSRSDMQVRVPEKQSSDIVSVKESGISRFGNSLRAKLQAMKPTSSQRPGVSEDPVEEDVKQQEQVDAVQGEQEEGVGQEGVNETGDQAQVSEESAEEKDEAVVEGKEDDKGAQKDKGHSSGRHAKKSGKES